MGGPSFAEADTIDRRFEAETRAAYPILGAAAAAFHLETRCLADHRSGPRAGDACTSR